MPLGAARTSSLQSSYISSGLPNLHPTHPPPLLHLGQCQCQRQNQGNSEAALETQRGKRGPVRGGVWSPPYKSPLLSLRLLCCSCLLLVLSLALAPSLVEEGMRMGWLEVGLWDSVEGQVSCGVRLRGWRDAAWATFKHSITGRQKNLRATFDL